jgi:hypothetical protein
MSLSRYIWNLGNSLLVMALTTIVSGGELVWGNVFSHKQLCYINLYKECHVWMHRDTLWYNLNVQQMRCTAQSCATLVRGSMCVQNFVQFGRMAQENA